MAKRKRLTFKNAKRPQASSLTTRQVVPLSTPPHMLLVELLSDTTFSRGEGTAAIVDTEVEHDGWGAPYIGGRTIRGLLRDTWLSMSEWFPSLHRAAERVLGRSQAIDDTCKLRLSDAVLPDVILNVVRSAVERPERPIAPDAILEAFTTVRFQTAEDRLTGAPEATTLRSSRVVLRGFAFESRLLWLDGYEPQADDLRVLALCALSCRHGGLLRNRGRGHLRMTLDGNLTLTQSYLERMP